MDVGDWKRLTAQFKLQAEGAWVCAIVLAGDWQRLTAQLKIQAEGVRDCALFGVDIQKERKGSCFFLHGADMHTYTYTQKHTHTHIHAHEQLQKRTCTQPAIPSQPSQLPLRRPLLWWTFPLLQPLLCPARAPTTSEQPQWQQQFTSQLPMPRPSVLATVLFLVFCNFWAWLPNKWAHM